MNINEQTQELRQIVEVFSKKASKAFDQFSEHNFNLQPAKTKKDITGMMTGKVTAEDVRNRGRKWLNPQNIDKSDQPITSSNGTLLDYRTIISPTVQGNPAKFLQAGSLFWSWEGGGFVVNVVFAQKAKNVGNTISTVRRIALATYTFHHREDNYEMQELAPWDNICKLVGKNLKEFIRNPDNFIDSRVTNVV